MAYNQTDPKELNDQQHSQATERQALESGQQLQQEQLRGLLQNPRVLEMLLDAGLSPSPDDLDGELAPYFHSDEILSINQDRDVWEKSWDAALVETRMRMAYPPQESKSPDERVQEVQRRMHGHDRTALGPDDRRQLDARMKQKADRARRARGGTFLELLLSQVVDVGETRSEDSGEGGLISRYLGGDR